MLLINLFSMFDPTSTYLSIGWLILPCLIILPLFKKRINNKLNKKIIKISNHLFSEISSNISNKSKFHILTLGSFFFLLLFFNTNALYPYTFTTTAHVSVNFSFAFTVWLSLILFQLAFNLKPTLTHLVPIGTPNLLLPIIVLIELTRIIIRPITLSVRLTANMIAGHLLISLLGEARAHSAISASYSYVIFILLLILESAVAIIQAYVFITLISLYTNEAL